ncbi:hypothetical protein LUZ61_006477 [Rhynchospora tenuis]|uniref:non-specific serine/threonine protein kinase n=1 Tax=Rhynchospora tenuis TaxID=198213 RepID=A0AAD5ZRQ0_9POAL|nr:hypothetical protein LUZ61_006477 [Rhynchospora tenuis]
MASPSLLKTFLILSATLALATPSFADNILYTDERLNPGQSLTYGTYFLIMQKDCNLVLYEMSQTIWSTKSNGKGQNCYLTIQRDGNLVIYTGSNVPIWATDTGKYKGDFVLVLQKDRNLVIYGPAYWHTGTLTAGSTLNLSIAGNYSTGPYVVNRDHNISMVTDHSEK